MGAKKPLIKRILLKQHPAGDLPFFLSIFCFAITLLSAVHYKSAFLLRISLFSAGGAFFYATLWLSFYNRYITSELEKAKKSFSISE
jgi:hypothetical protein